MKLWTFQILMGIANYELSQQFSVKGHSYNHMKLSLTKPLVHVQTVDLFPCAFKHHKGYAFPWGH